MKYAIIGSREFQDYFYLKNKMNKFNDITHSVSGGAKGADSLAYRYAKEIGIKVTEYLSDWDKYGQSAGFVRNKTIVENCDILVAFWNSVSKGTLNSIETAKKMNKQVIVFEYNKRLKELYLQMLR